MDRPPRTTMSDEAIDRVVMAFREQLKAATEKHSRGGCWSLQEILGLLTEEYYEALRAVHANNVAETRSECLDMMVAGAWGVISIDEGIVDGNWE